MFGHLFEKWVACRLARMEMVRHANVDVDGQCKRALQLCLEHAMVKRAEALVKCLTKTHR